jgi:hypothetical protein
MASCPQSVNFDEPSVHRLELLISRNAIRERQRSALRLHIGRGRRFSVGVASEGSGVPSRAIEAAMCFIDDENYRPLSLENEASLGKFLGVAFVSHYLELSGFGAFELMDEQPLPSVLNAESARPAETPREKVERLQRELFNAIEDLTA